MDANILSWVDTSWSKQVLWLHILYTICCTHLDQENRHVVRSLTEHYDESASSIWAQRVERATSLAVVAWIGNSSNDIVLAYLK